MSGVRTLAVIGAGDAGRGIAELAARRGVAVRLFDTIPRDFAEARERIRKSLDERAAAGEITRHQAAKALSRVRQIARMQDLRGADFIIEAVPEAFAIKKTLFRDLDGLIRRDVVLATSTSRSCVQRLAEFTHHPTRVLGMRFVESPFAAKLVEVVRHEDTRQPILNAARAFARRLGCVPVTVRDGPGFLVDRLFCRYWGAAQRLAAGGAGTFAGIDRAARERGVPAGPFETMDSKGLAASLETAKFVYEGLGRPRRLRPNPIQEELVAAGCGGRVSGKGFYLYKRGEPVRENPKAAALLPADGRPLTSDRIWNGLMKAVHGEGERIVAEGVAFKAGVDEAVRVAMGFPRGPFSWRRARR
ncbi:MAG: 3-hydroxyacyl-CoA dehydrogenase NAD-binding domain-containing protein [Elusimicrobiota bacterium]